MGRKELFEQAQAKVQKEKKEQESRSNYVKPVYDDIGWCPLKVEDFSVVRILGEPFHVRENSYSPKKIKFSKILNDKSKEFQCKWSEDKQWIMWRIFNTVMSYTYDKTTSTKVYKHANTFPHLFNRVHKNNKVANTYEKGWYPSNIVLMNVLDRQDPNWHKENKKWKLLSAKLSHGKPDPTTGEVRDFYNFGVPEGLYTMIFDSVMEDRGDWEDYDIAIKKLDDSPYYKTYSFHDRRKLPDNLQNVLTENPITAEERAYVPYDLDKMTQVTSYRKIKYNLGEFIKEVDACFKTKFTEELDKLCEKEEAEYLANKPDGEEEEDIIFTPREKTEAKVEVKPEVKVETKVEVKEAPAKRVVKSEGDFFQKAIEAGWKGITELTPEEKKQVVGIDLKTGKVSYVDLDGDPIENSEDTTPECSHCGLEVSLLVDTCLKCGAKF